MTVALLPKLWKFSFFHSASILKLTALICPFRFFASQLLICSRIQQQLQGRLKNALWHRTASFPLSRNFTLPILVIACNRLTVKRTLDSLLRYRSELVDLSPNQFPITVSHGCDHKPTRDILKSYKPAITVTEFLDDSSPSKFLGENFYYFHLVCICVSWVQFGSLSNSPDLLLMRMVGSLELSACLLLDLFLNSIQYIITDSEIFLISPSQNR